MWQFIKDYHFYQPEEKRAIIVLLALIMLTIGVTIVYERKYRPITSPDDELALQAFADSIQRRDSLASHRSRHNNYQRNGVQYSRRNQSQRFTTSRRQSERPIRVAKDTVSSLLIDTLPRYERVEKYEPGTLVDLNKADTAELKKIPGIGSGIAREHGVESGDDKEDERGCAFLALHPHEYGKHQAGQAERGDVGINCPQERRADIHRGCHVYDKSLYAERIEQPRNSACEEKS